MIIERIVIGSFGNLSDLHLEFGPGLNVLVGDNESGKSMVAAFIRYMLYGFAQNAPSDLPEREKRVSWQNGVAEGQMEVRLADGRRLRIQRRTVATEQAGRIGYREESSLVDLADGSVLPFRALPGDAFFAVPEQVYVNTAFFDQASGARFNQNEMAQAMENLLFSGDERVSSQRALKTMREARYSLSHPSGVGGAIYELSSQSDAIRIRLTQAMRRSAQIHKTEADLHKLSENIARAEAERDRLAEVEGYYRGYLTICSFDKLHEIESKYSSLSDERTALHREAGLSDFVPDEGYLASLQTAERVTEIARQNYLRTEEKVLAVKRNEELNEEEELLLQRADEAGGTAAVEREYAGLHKKAGLFRTLGWALLSLAVILLGLSLALLWPITLSPVSALLAVLVLCVVAASVVCFGNRRKTAERIALLCARFSAATGGDLLCRMEEAERARRMIRERHESILRAEENADISRGNYEALRAELLALAERWDRGYTLPPLPDKIPPISEDVRAFIERDRALAEELAEVRGRMSVLREELAGENEITVRAQVPPARREAMKKINFKTIQEGLAYYRTACENFHAQYGGLLGELNEYRRTAENPALLRAELAAMEDRVADLRRRYRAYGIASDAIGSASDRLRAEISPRLSEASGRMLSEATGGRYTMLEVTNRLAMAYRDEEGNARPFASISGSAGEIAYIALRLALIDMLYEETPPLCFDGSLAHQDDARISAMMKLLSAACESGMQSILLTCHRHEAEIAKAVDEGARCLTL